MHLLYISQAYHPNSAASITTQGIVEGLIKKGHSIDLLVALPCSTQCPPNCTFGCNRKERLNVRRSPFPSLASFERHMSMRVLAFSLAYIFIMFYALLTVRKRRVDIIITMYHATHLAPFCAFLISKFTGAPLVIKCHDVVSTGSRWGSLEQVFSAFTSRLNSIALKKATKILALSSELTLLIKSLYHVQTERFSIIPNGVDTMTFGVSEQGPKLREELGLQDKKVLLYMGSLEPPYRKKGIEFLLQTMQGVLAKERNVVLVIVGWVSKRVRMDLEALASYLKIEKSLNFIKEVAHEEMPMYISMADVCIGPLCPSIETYGSTPRKVLEYLACAKPVIAGKGGVSSDLIQNGHEGLLVNYGDFDGLRSSILSLVENPRLSEEMGQNGRRHAVTFYDESLIADRLNNELQKLYS